MCGKKKNDGRKKTGSILEPELSFRWKFTGNIWHMSLSGTRKWSSSQNTVFKSKPLHTPVHHTRWTTNCTGGLKGVPWFECQRYSLPGQGIISHPTQNPNEAVSLTYGSPLYCINWIPCPRFFWGEFFLIQIKFLKLEGVVCCTDCNAPWGLRSVIYRNKTD